MPKRTEAVSVVIPAFNEEDAVAQEVKAIEDVLRAIAERNPGYDVVLDSEGI